MYMKNAMYKIIVGCYIVAALVLVTACNDGWTFSRLTRSRWRRCPYPRN